MKRQPESRLDRYKRAGVSFLKRRGFVLLVILSYMAFACYYMGPSITSCTTTVYGFGDNTAGPIWRHSVSPSSPLWGFTGATNFPIGEDLFSPVHFSSVLQYSTYWAFQQVAGAICGINLVNFVGFVATALLMYLFVHRLTRNRWIAWLSGYAVSFAPFFQYKVGGHPSYGYGALLIACMWLSLRLLEKRRVRDAVFLAAAYAACFYWDPYFSLLAALIVGPILAVGLILAWRRSGKGRQLFRDTLKKIGIAAGTVVLFVLPLLAVFGLYSSQINAQVSGARGNIMVDAEMCSNLPWDYLIPSDRNYFGSKILGANYTMKVKELRHGCNPSEYTVGISLALITIAMVGALIFCWEKLQRRSLFKDVGVAIDYRLVFIATLAVLVVASLIALPPTIGELKTPSYFMLQNISVWRILSRIYMVVSIAVTVIAALAMMYFAKQPFLKSRLLRIALFVIIFLSIFVQYQAFRPLIGSQASFSYTRDLPQTYYWLRDQDDITSIAAYPMDKVGETDAISLYLTGQYIHKKPILNSTTPASPQEPMRFSLKDLTDPQTFPVLRGLGVDAVEIHSLTRNELAQIKDIEVLRYEEFENEVVRGRIAIARILPGPSSDQATILEKGFPINGPIMKSPISVEFEAVNGAVMARRETDFDSDQADGPVSLCFEAKTLKPTGDVLSLRLDGKELMSYRLSGEYGPVQVSVPLGQQVTLNSQSGDNMRLNNLGCR